MAIELNHTIVPAHDKVASAKWFAKLFGLSYQGAMGHFAPVRINRTGRGRRKRRGHITCRWLRNKGHGRR